MTDTDHLRALAALAHEHRLAVFRLLVAAGPSGETAGVMARTIGIAPTALSFHLKELDRAGLTRSWREGRYIRTAVVVERVRALISYLVDDCCGGRPELCGSAIAGLASSSCCPPGRRGPAKRAKSPTRKAKRVSV